jgi:hypothetical protein
MLQDLARREVNELHVEAGEAQCPGARRWTSFWSTSQRRSQVRREMAGFGPLTDFGTRLPLTFDPLKGWGLTCEFWRELPRNFLEDKF